MQSLDILRQRVTNPTFKPVLDDVYCSGCGRAARCPEAFEAHAGLFPGVYTASLLAGEKSGNLEQVLRRYVSYVKVVSGVPPQDDLRARLSRDPGAALDHRRHGDRGEGRPRVRQLLQPVRQGTAAGRRAFIVGLSTIRDDATSC